MIVVVGMAFEARIAAGLGVPIICGGDGKYLAVAGCGGLISFGVAGGLAPDLKPGTCVIGSAILHDEVERLTDARWAQRLMRIIPGAVHGPIAGVREPIDWRTVPAFFPIMFEFTVLISAFTATFGMLIMNGLPRLHHPMLGWERFKRVSDDKFFCVIEKRDPKFSEREVRDFLESIGGHNITKIHEN